METDLLARIDALPAARGGLPDEEQIEEARGAVAAIYLVLVDSRSTYGPNERHAYAQTLLGALDALAGREGD